MGVRMLGVFIVKMLVTVSMTMRAIVKMLVAVSMTMLMAMAYTVVAMLVTVFMDMLMAVLAFKILVRFISLPRKSNFIFYSSHYILDIIYTFLFLINCKLKQIPELCGYYF